jgi:uncharacterized membrane protein
VNEISQRNIAKLILVSIFVLLASLPSSNLQVEALTSVLYGRIIDSYGKPLPGVLISVYDISIVDPSGLTFGPIVGSYKSIAGGVFRVPVDPMNRLVFSKLGHVPFNVDYSDSYKLEIDLGTIVMENGLVLSSPSQDRVTAPGMNLKIPLLLDNRGEISESCKLALTEVKGWGIRLVDEIGEFNQITLPKGTAAKFSLEINVPRNATGVTSIALNVYGYSNITWGFLVEVKQPDVSLIKCIYPSKTVFSGNTARYKLDIVNGMSVSDEIQLVLNDLPAGWKGLIINGDGEQINEVSLDPGSTIGITVEVLIPEGVSQGTYRFKVTGEANGLKDVLELAALVENSTRARVLLLGTRYPSQTVQIGKAVVYDLSIFNPISTQEIVSLSSSGLPQDWILRFKNKDGAEIQQVSVPGENSESLSVEVTPSLTTEPSKYTFTIMANSPSLKGEIKLVTGIESSYSLQINLSNLYEEMKVGESKTLNVKVTNNGFSPVSDLVLTIVTTSPTLQLEQTPEKAPLLKPNESQVFLVKIKASEGTSPGDYVLKIGAQSKEYSVTKDENIVRLTIGQSSDITLITGLIAVFAVGAVIVVMLKFKRR